MRYRKPIRPYTPDAHVDEEIKNASRKNPKGQCDQVRHPQEKDNRQASDKKTER